MERIQLMLHFLREIHVTHLTTVRGHRFDLILANDHAMLALLNGDEQAVQQYANKAWRAYIHMDFPQNMMLTQKLWNLVKGFPVHVA